MGSSRRAGGGLSDLQIGVLVEGFDPLRVRPRSAAAVGVFAAAVEDSGARVREVSVPALAGPRGAEHLRCAFDRALEGLDFLLLPSTPANALPFSLSGHPAISLPVTPLGATGEEAMLVGPRRSHAELRALARRVRATLNCHERGRGEVVFSLKRDVPEQCQRHQRVPRPRRGPRVRRGHPE